MRVGAGTFTALSSEVVVHEQPHTVPRLLDRPAPGWRGALRTWTVRNQSHPSTHPSPVSLFSQGWRSGQATAARRRRHGQPRGCTEISPTPDTELFVRAPTRVLMAASTQVMDFFMDAPTFLESKTKTITQTPVLARHTWT